MAEQANVLGRTLRPKSFKSVHGQGEVIAAIRKQVSSGRMPNAWLFTGPPGTGKTSMARIIHRAANCRHMPPAKFGAFCKPCWQNQSSLQLDEINASHIRGVDDIEQIAVSSTYAPQPPARYRTIILDEAQKLSKAAQNLLLKYLEEPPPTTLWMLATTDPDDLLPAIRSRCKTATYKMRPLRGKVLEDFVKWAAVKGGITRPLDDLIEYAHRADLSSPRDLLGALEQYNAGLDPDKAASTSARPVDTLAICKSLVAGEWSGIRQELAKATPDDWRYVQAGVIGFLRQNLLRPQTNLERKTLSYAIQYLTQGIGWGQDDSITMAVLAAKLFDLTKKF